MNGTRNITGMIFTETLRKRAPLRTVPAPFAPRRDFRSLILDAGRELQRPSRRLAEFDRRWFCNERRTGFDATHGIRGPGYDPPVPGHVGQASGQRGRRHQGGRVMTVTATQERRWPLSRGVLLSARDEGQTHAWRDGPKPSDPRRCGSGNAESRRSHRFIGVQDQPGLERAVMDCDCP